MDLTEKVNPNGGDLTGFKIQLDSLIAVINETEKNVNDAQKKLDACLKDIWLSKEKWTEELLNFNETRGVLSSWWNSQYTEIKNQSLENESNSRRLKEKTLQKKNSDIAKDESRIEELKKELETISNKLTTDESFIMELRKQEEELQQEPFGVEFLSIKADIQKCQRSYVELREIVSTEDTDGPAGGPSFMTDFDELVEAPTPDGFTTVSALFNAKPSHSKRPQRVFKVKEKTTIALKRQKSLLGYKRMGGDEAKSENEYWQTAPDEEEIIHD